MRAMVDADVCTGCGLCVDTCPEVFEMGEEEDVATVKVATIPESAAESAREAEENCPVEAITIEE